MVASSYDDQLTRMICTLGPASSEPKVLSKLIEAGMSVARLNFSHGDHASQLALLRTVREVARRNMDAAHKPVAIMLDTKGPEIRTGRTEGGEKVHYARGQEITLTSDYETICDSSTLALSYAKFPTSVRKGQPIRIGDGALNLEVTNVDDAEHGRVRAQVLNDAAIGERKNCNIPGVRVDLPLLSAKDERDLVDFALAHGVDFVALSFVQDAESVEEVRTLLAKNCKEGQTPPKLIAKIENGEGLLNFDAILEVADGIMVARGDLGMEIPMEKIFMAQKMMIQKTRAAGKIAVTATEMLASMEDKPFPSRAEACDVANAVLDGSSMVMLSGEVANGDFPVETTNMMRRIVEEAEAALAE